MNNDSFTPATSGIQRPARAAAPQLEVFTEELTALYLDFINHPFMAIAGRYQAEFIANAEQAILLGTSNKKDRRAFKANRKLLMELHNGDHFRAAVRHEIAIERARLERAASLAKAHARNDSGRV